MFRHVRLCQGVLVWLHELPEEITAYVEALAMWRFSVFRLPGAAAD
jgi:hypothetical protein